MQQTGAANVQMTMPAQRPLRSGWALVHGGIVGFFLPVGPGRTESPGETVPRDSKDSPKAQILRAAPARRPQS